MADDELKKSLDVDLATLNARMNTIDERSVSSERRIDLLAMKARNAQAQVEAVERRALVALKRVAKTTAKMVGAQLALEIASDLPDFIGDVPESVKQFGSVGGAAAQGFIFSGGNPVVAALAAIAELRQQSKQLDKRIQDLILREKKREYDTEKNRQEARAWREKVQQDIEIDRARRDREIKRRVGEESYRAYQLKR